MKRNKIMAILGAAALTLGVVGVAFAEDLNSGQVGDTLSSFDQSCDGFPLEVGAGQIGVHFVLTTPDGDATSANLWASFSNPSSSVGPVANTAHPSTTLHFYVVITGDGDTTIDSASTDVDGGNLNVSHVCAGEETSSSSTTSFESSVESTTESQSTSTEETSSTSEETSSTSFESSVESTTDSQSSSTASTTSFSDSVSDTVSQPPTDTIGNSGSGQQSSGLWMLLAALGVLGGSIIVLAPSKAKTKE
jgi:hypothetical protein